MKFTVTGVKIKMIHVKNWKKSSSTHLFRGGLHTIFVTLFVFGTFLGLNSCQGRSDNNDLLGLILFAIANSSGGDSTTEVTINWEPNKEILVNQKGGGYMVCAGREESFSVEDATCQDVPYVSGDQAPTETILNLKSGVWYIKMYGYSSLNEKGTISEPLTVQVP